MEKKENKKVSPALLILFAVLFVVGIFVFSKIYEFGMNALYSWMYGEDAEYYGATEYIDINNEAISDASGNGSYVLDNYQVNIKKNRELSEVYGFIDEFRTEYENGNYEFFDDFTSYEATGLINKNLRAEYGTTAFKIEGQIISIEGDGNMYRIYDMYTANEGAHAYDRGILPDILDVYVDFSMLENKDELFMNDYVTVYVYMPGTIPMQDGTSIPCLIALGAEV